MVIAIICVLYVGGWTVFQYFMLVKMASFTGTKWTE